MPRAKSPEPKAESPEPRAARRAAPLTPRERSVVAAVLEGSTNKVIAAKLGLREQTVKNHLSSIFGKLGLANRLELALFAMEREILQQGPEGNRGPEVGDRGSEPSSATKPEP